MDDTAIANLKDQIAKRFDYTSWDALIEKAKSTQLCHGDFRLYPEMLEEMFGWTTEKGDKFQVGKVMIVVPFTTFDSSLNGQVIATHNLVFVKHVEHEQAEAMVYHKSIAEAPAYMVYFQSEDGPTIFEF